RKSGAPILFYTGRARRVRRYDHLASHPLDMRAGNEGNIFAFYNNTGFMWDLAEVTGGLIVFCEHRYYGDSLPFGTTKSFERDHVGYLSPEQALADFALLLVHLRESDPLLAHSPAVAFGGSYGGTLAAWLRLRYPNVVDAALAASAPLR